MTTDKSLASLPSVGAVGLVSKQHATALLWLISPCPCEACESSLHHSVICFHTLLTQLQRRPSSSKSAAPCEQSQESQRNLFVDSLRLGSQSPRLASFARADSLGLLHGDMPAKTDEERQGGAAERSWPTSAMCSTDPTTHFTHRRWSRRRNTGAVVEGDKRGKQSRVKKAQAKRSGKVGLPRTVGAAGAPGSGMSRRRRARPAAGRMQA